MDAKSIDVVVGTTKWRTGGDHYKPLKLIPHDLFGKVESGYDIGLIKLEKPLVFNERVRDIKYSAKELPANQKLTVSGWGRLSVRNFPCLSIEVFVLIFHCHVVNFPSAMPLQKLSLIFVFEF